MYAIIHSESDFSPGLISDKSAMGLMQLLPSTASDEVHRFLYGRPGAVSFNELRVPEINIRYGTAYLHILLTRYFSGVHDPLAREYCAVAAYNMGPNRFLRLYGATNEEAVDPAQRHEHGSALRRPDPAPANPRDAFLCGQSAADERPVCRAALSALALDR